MFEEVGGCLVYSLFLLLVVVVVLCMTSGEQVELIQAIKIKYESMLIIHLFYLYLQKGKVKFQSN